MAQGRRKHSVAAVLKSLREKRRWSLDDVAKWTGIPRTTLYQYEIGKSQVPPDRLELLARLYNVSVDYLVTGQDSPGQFARQYPEHFQLLSRAAKELPGDRFERLKKFMEYFLDHKGEIPDLDWEKIISAHQDSLKSEET